MRYILILVTVLGIAIQQVSQKAYNKKESNGIYTFTMASAFTACIFFLVTSGGKMHFSKELLFYSVGFAAMYSITVLSLFVAIRSGPLSLTALISSCSLAIPTVFGFIVLNEEVTAARIIGILFILLSLLIINIKKDSGKITLKWTVAIFLTFLANGMCTVFQKLQQNRFGGLFKNEFMFVALLITVFILLIPTLIYERKILRPILKKGILYYVINGVSNGAANLLILYLARNMAASLMFPMISGGSIIVTALVSVLYYKEKLSKTQIVGVIFGIAAVVLLSI